MDTIILSGLIGAVAFGILSAIVANNKHRDGFGWFVLGFLFGPFGFVASLVVEKLEPDQNQTRASSISTSSKQSSDRPTLPAMPSESSTEDDETHCPECLEPVRAKASRCKHCGANITSDTSASPNNDRSSVSALDYKQLARRREIISRVQDDMWFFSKMKEADWQFTLSQGIEEIASSVTAAAQEVFDMPTVQSRGPIARIEEYFAHVGRDVATREAYNLLLADKSDVGSLGLELIEELDLLDVEKSAELLRSGDLDVRKRALASFRLHPRRYFREDVGHLKDAKARVPGAFPIIAEEVEIDRFLKSKPAVKWECPCDNQNDLKVEYCTSCGQNRRGFKKDELKPEEAVNVIDNRIELLEELLPVEN